jgi:choline-phosphate cytidylyltransferase
MTKVITYGTYDLLHHGHIRLLERAKALGDYLIVGITSDDYDMTRGKINSIQSLAERIDAVKATGIADEIIVEEYEGQKIDDIKRLNVDIFTVGSDWVGKFDYLNEYCKVVYLDRTKGVSSSELRGEERKLKISIDTNNALGKKVERESAFVNGVEIVARGEEDAIYLTSKPTDHYHEIKEHLTNGRSVLCESPIALNKKQCEELFALAHDKNLVLMDAIKTAYSTAYSRLLLLIKSGKIGDVVSVDATCTSLRDLIDNNLVNKWNSISAWGPTALLPIFQILGTDYVSKTITTKYLDKSKNMDAFTKIDFLYPNAVASIKVAKGAKSEGELVISGTKGYIYVPAPWWKTDYFEVRFEEAHDTKRYFYQLDGEGIRYEVLAFAKSCAHKQSQFIYVDKKVSLAICEVMEDFYTGNVKEI